MVLLQNSDASMENFIREKIKIIVGVVESQSVLFLMIDIMSIRA